MRRPRPRAATMLGIIVLDLPVAFALTMMLLPVWTTIERRSGIESVGHSGPATWCFVLVYVCVVALSLGTYLYRLGRASVGADGGVPR